MIPALRQRRKIVESLYHVHSTENRIAALDSMIPTLRQRRKIAESLYHDDSFENTIERHDSMNASLQRSCKIVRSLYHQAYLPQPDNQAATDQYYFT